MKFQTFSIMVFRIKTIKTHITYIIGLIFSLMVFFACSNSTQTSENDNKINKQDSVPLNSTDSLSFQKFPEADILLHHFLSNLDSLSNFIDSKGVYCLESSEGATPLLTHLKSESDLLAKTEFLFLFRDFSFSPNKVYVNDASADPCNEEKEGYYIYDLKQPQTILEELYRIQQSQSGSLPKDSTLLELKKTDSDLFKKVIINFKSKHGDSILLKLYFRKKENKIYLSILDLTDCGV